MRLSTQKFYLYGETEGRCYQLAGERLACLIRPIKERFVTERPDVCFFVTSQPIYYPQNGGSLPGPLPARKMKMAA